MTQNKNSSTTEAMTIIGIIISWFTFWIFLLSPFGLLAWILILLFLLYKRTRVKRYILLSAWVSVPILSFIVGTYSYFNGTAELKGIGGPNLYHGIDKETRLSSFSSGCIFIGFEPFIYISNNSAVRLCTKLFGFQKGAYKGYFPTVEEASNISIKGDTIDVNHVNNYLQFRIRDKTVLLDTSDLKLYRINSFDFNQVKATVINNECLIAQNISETYDKRHRYIIVDIEKERLIQVYREI